MPNWKTYESSVRLLSAIVAAHPGLKLNYDEIARCYGAPTKGKDVRNFYDRTIKHDVQLILKTLEDGGNPLDVELAYFSKQKGGGGAPKAIAREYGDGVTGADGATPAKAKRGGGAGRGRGKKAAAPTNGNGVTGGSGEDDDEEGSFEETPSKKTPLNKTKGGRVAKPSSGRPKKAVNYQESDDEDDMKLVKYEGGDMNGGGFQDINYGNGHNGNGGHSFQEPDFSQGYVNVAEGGENETWYDAGDNDEA